MVTSVAALGDRSHLNIIVTQVFQIKCVFVAYLLTIFNKSKDFKVHLKFLYF